MIDEAPLPSLLADALNTAYPWLIFGAIAALKATATTIAKADSHKSNDSRFISGLSALSAL